MLLPSAPTSLQQSMEEQAAAEELDGGQGEKRAEEHMSGSPPPSLRTSLPPYRCKASFPPYTCCSTRGATIKEGQEESSS
jgi:hypothetical protein